MSKELKTTWDIEEDDFAPWSAEENWHPIACFQFPAGTDFTCDGGKMYRAVEDDSDVEKLPYQILAVSWKKRIGRAGFGYVVRKSDTGEVVAAIHQGSGWSWWFKFKYEPKVSQNWSHQNGWRPENLMARTMNTVMSLLLS